MKEAGDERDKKITIHDVAKEAGTSIATVSRVLSRSGYPVRKELRNRILEAAEKLNYIPNLAGRMLKKDEGLDIGVIVPDITKSYYAHMVLGIESEAAKKGRSVLLCNSFNKPEIEARHIEILCQKRVRGILIGSPVIL